MRQQISTTHPRGGSLLDIDRVAQTLGVTPRFVRRLVAERRIPFIKIGKFVRFDPGELDLWIEGNRVASERSAPRGYAPRR